jgi:two-component system, NarL family, response regulator NreC
MSGPIRVMVVDDHAVLRSGLRLVLDREDDIEWVGEAATAEDALRAVERLDPALVIMDLEMPGMGGLAGLERLRERRPDVAVLVLSMHDEADQVRRAFEAGAVGYVLKTAADEDLVRAIRAIAGGEPYVHPAVGAILARPAPSRGALDELSARELEVLRLLALGYTNQEIATRLVVSVRTVESHRAHVMTKLRADSRAQMVRAALDAGLLEEPET